MEAQHPEPPERDRQKSSAFSQLPIEILYLIVSGLDAASILSLRLTCYLALHWVLPSFRKLFKSRRYFLHPYSFNLLEELSLSPFAECVERIVIGTETFQWTFHLTATEYGRTLTSTLQRFINLRAVEIRDDVPSSSKGYHHDDFLINTTGMHSVTQRYRDSRGYGSPYWEQYNSRWGEEEDHLHSQGFRRVSAGYSTLAFRKPLFISKYRFPRLDPSRAMEELFDALMHACTVAKTAGVNVTDFRVALMYEWGIQWEILAGFISQDRSQFLSSLEVLHLALYYEGGRGPPMNIEPFTSAFTSLKWVRVVFGGSGLSDPGTQHFITLLSQMGERSPLNRLELGDVDIDGPTLTSLILNFRPKILNIWVAFIRESGPGLVALPDADDVSEWGWGKILRDVAGVVGQVRLAHAEQYNGRQMTNVRLVQAGGVSTLPDVEHEYIHLSPDSVEDVVRDMVISSPWVFLILPRGWPL